jgi:ParB/RepB/Spo0J family partition protein
MNETTLPTPPPTADVQTVMIALGRLKPSPTQPRKHFDEDKAAELTVSMQQHGFTLSALLVRPWPKQAAGNGETLYEIVTGERRWRAAQAAKIDRAPCIVREMTDQQVLETQLIENIAREDLTPIEEAQHYKRLLDMRDENGKPLYTYESLGMRIGRTAWTIRNKVALCGLDEEGDVRKEVEAGRLSPNTAVLIARVPDEAQREKFAQRVLRPQHKTGPLSFADAQAELHRNFIRDLRTAQFDLSDGELVPIERNEANERVAGGTCDDCPLRSTNRNANGEASENGGNVKGGAARGMCLNPVCFERKQQRVWERWQEDNTDLPRSRRATSESESRKLYPFGNQLSALFGFIDLDERPDGNDLRAGVDCSLTWRRLTEGAELPVIVTKDRLEKTHELVDRLKAIEAARTLNKHDIFKAQQRSEPRKTDETRKTEEKKKSSESEHARAVLLACFAEIAAQPEAELLPKMAALVRLLIDRELESSEGEVNEFFFKRHHLPIGGSVAKPIAKRPLPELVAMLVEFVVAEAGNIYDLHENDVVWLKTFGVDYGATEKRLAKEAKAAAANPPADAEPNEKKANDDPAGHKWEKTDLVSGANTNYRCTVCSAKGVRFGVSWPPTTKAKGLCEAPATKPKKAAAKKKAA